jgi:hypothetical protein
MYLDFIHLTVYVKTTEFLKWMLDQGLIVAELKSQVVRIFFLPEVTY